ncbi:uncharacterized protein LOC116338341 [Contarinia nasturtii]|uniref:uncharacterized protein LOC116338341 n=1 Tax=Contarinia nasturtii TaxID=265458 RepID=UPI0012D48E43|nr:uncharacterized protein LOC116338341 [Contarinia nasturtii]
MFAIYLLCIAAFVVTPSSAGGTEDFVAIAGAINCLEKEVKNVVGDDRKYNTWFTEVQRLRQSNSNAFQSCTKGMRFQPFDACFSTFATIMRGQINLQVNKLSTIDNTKNWSQTVSKCL